MEIPDPADIRARLEQYFLAGVRAVDPLIATRRALDLATPPRQAPGIIATGKASVGMARAAVEWLAAHGLSPIGGMVVHHGEAVSPHPALVAVPGDHPVPGERSQTAADAVAACIASWPATTPVLVFLSGGTSSLLGAPLPGITPAELRLAFTVFHELGLDIAAMNQLRRQLTRWSNGRLAAALAPRPVQAWVISDVIGNDPSTIGSGPLVQGDAPDPNLLRVLASTATRLPDAVRAALSRTDAVSGVEIAHHVVADARIAAEATARAATADSLGAVVHREALIGDARRAGETLANWIHAEIDRRRLPDRRSGVLVRPVDRVGEIHVWASESTVTLPAGHGLGGRAQQFALAVAQQIGSLRSADATAVLIAGTDGRDGPTDAAGAVIDPTTTQRLRTQGIDVEHALDRCDAYPALEAAGALLRTGSTGTNVADLVVVWLWNWY